MYKHKGVGYTGEPKTHTKFGGYGGTSSSKFKAPPRRGEIQGPPTGGDLGTTQWSQFPHIGIPPWCKFSTTPGSFEKMCPLSIFLGRTGREKVHPYRGVSTPLNLRVHQGDVQIFPAG